MSCCKRSKAKAPAPAAIQTTLSSFVHKKEETHVKSPGASWSISPLACRKWAGAHVSMSGGLFQAVHHTRMIKGHSFALFLKNQRRWDSTPLTRDAIDSFRSACSEHNFTNPWNILPHGSYLINLGNPDEEKRSRSFDSFLDDLVRCEQLGIHLYNFHPGSTIGACTTDQSIDHIADCINKAHAKTRSVVTVLENMAGQGNVIGSSFKELAGIIELVKDKSRIGICLDTCHLFAAGYDIRTADSFDSVLKDFDETIGLKYLKAVHLNDSKEGLNSKKDRHENLGKGKIGMGCFRFIMNDDRFNDLPLVLETPSVDGKDIYQEEIELLYSLVMNK